MNKPSTHLVCVAIGLITAAIVIITIAIGGCTSKIPVVANQATEPLKVEAPFFIPGEQMSWDISIHGMRWGEMDMMTGEPGVIDGCDIIVVRSRVRSTGVAKMIRSVSRDTITWVDLESSLPIHVRSISKVGNTEKMIEGRYDAEALGETIHDMHSLLGVFRAWSPTGETQAHFYASLGGRLWHGTVRLAGHELVRIKARMVSTTRLDGAVTRLTEELKPRAKPRRYTLWIANSVGREPVRLVVRAYSIEAVMR